MTPWNDPRLAQAHALVRAVLVDVKAGNPMEETVDHLDSILDSIDTVDADVTPAALAKAPPTNGGEIARRAVLAGALINLADNVNGTKDVVLSRAEAAVLREAADALSALAPATEKE